MAAHRALAVAVLLLSTACTEQGASPGVLVVDTGAGALVVGVDPSTGATTPTYSWDGAAARELSVTRADGTAIAWRLEATDASRGFPPPVRQGVVPEEATETVPGTLLEPGVDYRVKVMDIDGASGSRIFRP